MQEANQLTIDAKIKEHLLLTVAVTDFKYSEGQPLDARIVIQQPNISLYCLDHANQRAIFVETSPDVDLLKAPFYYVAQYEAAQRLIAVPYDVLHNLTREVQIDPARIILIYSTGRCGSTLVSHMFNQTPDVASFSEPDVFTQLMSMRSKGEVNDAALKTLLHDSLLVMCANARLLGKEGSAFKFRSFVISLSDVLYQAVPEAKIVYLYRDAVSWAASLSRAFGLSDEMIHMLMLFSHRWLIPLVNEYYKVHTEPIPFSEFLARMWVSCMQDAVSLQHSLQQQGAAIFTARFNELKKEPHQVIEAMFAHCGIRVPDVARVDQTLSEDSQAGTDIDQTQQGRTLTEHDIAELRRLIPELDPTLTADSLVPQTFLA